MKIEGKKVHDAKRKLVITVSPADIRKSKRKDPSNCAVAVAVRRCTKAHKVLVHKSRAYVQPEPNAEWTRYEVGAATLSELVSFDRGAGFQPDEYTLRPLRPSATIEAHAERWDNRRKRPAHTGKKRNPPHIVLGIRINAPKGRQK